MNFGLSTNYKLMYENITKQLKQFCNNNPKLEGFVLGLSGGVDSCLVAVIIRNFITENNLKLKLIGYSLPSFNNKKDEENRAWVVGTFICDHFEVINISPIFGVILPTINSKVDFTYAKDDLNYKIRMGNIQARTRMIMLYDLARKENCIVLSTDNLTEYYLGFWTLHGDVGDLGPIQGLWKTEVFGLADYLASTMKDQQIADGVVCECTKAKPTDGLGVSDSDIEQLLPDWKGTNWRAAYEEIDKILIEYINAESYAEVARVMKETPKEDHLKYDSHPVVRRYLNTHFKRNNPLNFTRGMLLGE